MSEPTRVVWLGIARNAGVDDGRFDRAVEDLRAQLAGVIPGMGAWDRMAEDPAEGTAHRAAMKGAPEAFDALVGILSADPDVFDRAADAAGAIDWTELDAIDRDRCGVIAGNRLIVKLGNGPIFATFWLRPAKGRSIGECQTYWRGDHGKLGEERLSADPIDSAFGYEQIHSDIPASERIAHALGFAQFDYIGSLRGPCASHSQFNTPLRSDYVAQVALPDERKFIDHSRSSMGLYTPTRRYARILEGQA